MQPVMDTVEYAKIAKEQGLVLIVESKPIHFKGWAFLGVDDGNVASLVKVYHNGETLKLTASQDYVWEQWCEIH